MIIIIEKYILEEHNKRDQAAHERIFKTKTRPLPFFLLSQNTYSEEANDAKDIQTLDICQLHLKIVHKPTSNKEIRKTRNTTRAPQEFQSHLE
jgi:hypothetical protein